MNIDDRGRRAAENLRRTVQHSPLLLMERGVSGATRSGLQSRLLSFAGAFAAVLLLVGLTLVQVDLFSPEADTSPTLVTIPVDPVPVDPPPTTSSTAVPREATTTSVTTAAPTTSTVATDVDPPPITITNPVAGATVAESGLRFEGTTEPGARVTAGPYQAAVDPTGHWSIVLVLNEGGNLARFTATDPAGNTAEASVSVTYRPPPPPKEEPPPVDFTAHQTWGSCSFDPPYDEFYGTGKPGSTIEVVSEFGSGAARVSEGGEWYVKVYFETAPPGLVFAVKAKDAFGNKKVFEFTSTVGS